ncbi:T9SS type A sorting domain-containing protein [Bacteroidota bacterium]
MFSRSICIIFLATSIIGYAQTSALKQCSTPNDENMYESLILLFPNEGRFSYMYNLSVEWESINVESIDIEYSMDNGNSWDSIVSNYQSDQNYYSWNIPDVTSDSFRIRISDHSNPNLYDESNSTIEIVPFFRIGEGSNPSNDSYDYIAINEVLMWISNCGDGSHDPITNLNGYYWPDGLNAYLSAVFEDGLVFGGIVNDQIQVNGNTNRQGLQAGYILSDATASDPNEPVNKIWKIRKDWQSLPDGPWKEQYEYDYNNWPGEFGAPFIDNNGDGIFTTGIDEPEFVGDEVLFYIANDLDSSRANYTYGSQSIGIEFQTTVWGFNTYDFLKDVVFKKYKMINKSDNLIKNVYFSYWMDDDLGDANDDYAGCDTLLSLAYTYNGYNKDHQYKEAPPAVGHMLLQGPVVPADPTDSAKFNNEWLKGYKNMPMTSYVFYISSDAVYHDPSQGRHEGAIQFYNQMQGFIFNGDPVIDPNTGKQTKFCLSGDPVAKTGWNENGWPSGPAPGERRAILTSGPINMEPVDTQEVVYAIFMARGSDNIQSVAELKKTGRKIHEFWSNDIPTTIEEPIRYSSITRLQYKLSQNYPNPFNPSTKIRYSIPQQSFIQLRIYDVVGREITTLINKEQPQGFYEVDFNGSDLSSGIYFYQLRAGDFINTKKMILVK